MTTKFNIGDLVKWGVHHFRITGIKIFKSGIFYGGNGEYSYGEAPENELELVEENK